MSLFAGFGKIIDDAFGLDETWQGRAPRYRHRSTLLRLCRENRPLPDCEKLVGDLYAKMESNWDGQPSTSKQNWRFTQNTTLVPHNTSPEVTLQRTFIRSADPSEWANDVPVDAGVNGQRGRFIDLVHHDGDAYEIIELKWGSNTPLSAAMQVLGYGMAYLFSRVHAGELGYLPSSYSILNAERVTLVTLASTAYYARYGVPHAWLDTLENQITQSLRDVRFDSTLQTSFEIRPVSELLAEVPKNKLECLFHRPE